jgi:hypothetical protein
VSACARRLGEQLGGGLSCCPLVVEDDQLDVH